MEKTASEHFAQEVEINKEEVEARKKCNEAEKEITKLRNELDAIQTEYRTKIRTLEQIVKDWKVDIREKATAAKDEHVKAWESRHSGL